MTAPKSEDKDDRLLDGMDKEMKATAKPDKKIVNISHNHAGELHALCDDGKVYKYGRDPAALNQPGVHMSWQEIPGP